MSRHPKAPTYRTSPMQSYLACRPFSPFSMTGSSTFFALATRSFSNRYLIASYAAAMATGWAWYVAPQPSGLVSKCSLISSRTATMERGR